MKVALGYCRQSTVKQERSGLSIEFQKQDIEGFCRQRGMELAKTFIETESGTKTTQDRPQLRQALELCRKHGFLLVISKLDRLARNASFLLGLRDSGVEFVCCDLPDANRLTVSLLAVIAEAEQVACASRTRNALAMKRIRCQEQGIPFFQKQGETLRRVQASGIAVIKQRASERILQRKPAILKVFNGSGEKKYLKTAQILNELGLASLSGKGSWTATGVRRLLRAG